MEEDYALEIEHLRDLITLVQTNVTFTLTIVVAILGVAIAAAGWALYVLARKWVDERVEKELNVIEEKVKSFSLNNPQFLWASSSGVLTSISMDANGGNQIPTYQLHGLDNFKEENLVYLDVYYIFEKNRQPITDYEIEYIKNGVSISIPEKSQRNTFNPNRQVHIFLLWHNPVFINALE